MSKTEIEIDLHENSLDNSRDGEFMGMVDDESFCDRKPYLKIIASEERSQLLSEPFMETNEEESNSAYYFKDMSGNVTYKIEHMRPGEESASNISSHSPTHGGEFYVVSHPVEVFGSSATQKRAMRRDPLQTKAVTAKKRDDKRRATHNEVERRRRDKINSWITKLAALVPDSGLPDTASKGGILAKACDHITNLTTKQKRLDKLEEDNEKLVLEILRLNQELTDLRKENSSMRNQLADNSIIVAHNNRSKGQKS